MKKTYGIYLFFIFAALLGLIMIATSYYFFHHRQMFRSSENMPGIRIAEENEHLIVANDGIELLESTESATAVEPYQYLLREKGGYVVVYASDGKTIFENTAIKVRSLSEDLQEEIGNGKPIYSEAELYDFLENHSS